MCCAVLCILSVLHHLQGLCAALVAATRVALALLHVVCLPHLCCAYAFVVVSIRQLSLPACTLEVACVWDLVCSTSRPFHCITNGIKR